MFELHNHIYSVTNNMHACMRTSEYYCTGICFHFFFFLCAGVIRQFMYVTYSCWFKYQANKPRPNFKTSIHKSTFNLAWPQLQNNIFIKALVLTWPGLYTSQQQGIGQKMLRLFWTQSQSPPTSTRFQYSHCIYTFINMLSKWAINLFIFDTELMKRPGAQKMNQHD